MLYILISSYRLHIVNKIDLIRYSGLAIYLDAFIFLHDLTNKKSNTVE